MALKIHKKLGDDLVIVLDFEVFKYDWTLWFLDTDKRQGYHIVNDQEALQRFYDTYKEEIMIGYNINHYDRYIMQGILAGFDPYEISQWIIVDGQQGWAFSELLRTFPVGTYDTMIPNKGLKRCEASLGMAIVESSIPFDIDRKLTKLEIREVLRYNRYDVMATFEVFLQDGFYLSPQSEFQSSMQIIDEFKFPKWYMSKTKSQLGCSVLGATYSSKLKDTSDEFDILSPDNVILGKYEYVREWFLNPDNHWYNKPVDGRKQPMKNELVTEIGGIPTTLAWGGSHGSVTREIVDGQLIMCDFGSLYPNIMVNYDLVSRGVPNSKKYEELLETRLKLKAEGNDRQESYKIALNGSYGQMKYNGPLYDPRNGNNVCVHGQLISIDLVEKIEPFGDIININTDGVLIRVYSDADRLHVEEACKLVSDRLSIPIDFDYYTRWIIKDVNNYLAIEENGKVTAKGGYVKFQSPLEYNYNIINHAIREHFVNGTSVEQTIMSCNDLIEFQIISNAGQKYEYAMYGDTPLMERVNRVFASTDSRDKGIFKLHKETGTKAKIEMTPEQCFIINDDIRGMKIPSKLDRQWYIDLANRRVKEFVK